VTGTGDLGGLDEASLSERELALVRRIRGLLAEKAGLAAAAGAAQYLHDPLGFTGNCVQFRPGGGLTAYQREIIGVLPEARRGGGGGARGGGDTKRQ
jgi:hypothetical protein